MMTPEVLETANEQKCSFFFPIPVSLHKCVHVYIYVHECVNTWRPRVNVKYLSQSFPTLLFEIDLSLNLEVTYSAMLGGH